MINNLQKPFAIILLTLMFISSVALAMYMDDYHILLATGSLSTLDENFVTTIFHLSKYTFFISAALAVLLWVHTLWTECNKETE